jgi:hypothetical protein
VWFYLIVWLCPPSAGGRATRKGGSTRYPAPACLSAAGRPGRAGEARRVGFIPPRKSPLPASLPRITPLTCDDAHWKIRGRKPLKIMPSALALAAIATFTVSAAPVWAATPPDVVPSPAPVGAPVASPAAAGTPAASPATATNPATAASQPAAFPPECAYFPVLPECLEPLLGSLPACPRHVWVHAPDGWACASTQPVCHGPFELPMMVDGEWDCVGGPGPVVVPPMEVEPVTAPALAAEEVEHPRRLAGAFEDVEGSGGEDLRVQALRVHRGNERGNVADRR